MGLENLPIEVVLVTIIGWGWATLGTVLALTKHVDQKRSEILLARDANGPLQHSHRVLIYKSDWLPFKIVLIGFVLVTSTIYLALGVVVLLDDTTLILWAGAVVTIFGGLGVVGGLLLTASSLYERRKIRESLQCEASDSRL